jgi:hypothetical protein
MLLTINKFLHKILSKYYNTTQCTKCDSYNTCEGHYSRAYDTTHKQASGDRGLWCNDCSKVTWFSTDEEFIEKSPYWIEITINNEKVYGKLYTQYKRVIIGNNLYINPNL